MLAASGARADAPPELVEPGIAADQVAGCGFASVRVKFDDLLHEEVIEVAELASASDEQLACAARASLATSYDVEFPEDLRGSCWPDLRAIGAGKGQIPCGSLARTQGPACPRARLRPGAVRRHQVRALARGIVRGKCGRSFREGQGRAHSQAEDPVVGP